MKLIEAVINFSEGRDSAVISEICSACSSANEFSSKSSLKILHVDSGASANRTVITLAGSPEDVVQASFDLVKRAVELIDMTKHRGEHPRLGAVDVLPLIPISGISAKELLVYLYALAERIFKELSLAIYFYDMAAKSPERRNLAYCRKGSYESLQSRYEQGVLLPDLGPKFYDEHLRRSGAINMAVRPFLIAVNFNIETKDLEAVKKIASAVRESGDLGVKYRRELNTSCAVTSNKGRLRGLKAIAWYIEEYACAQVSCNICELEYAPLELVYERISEEAQALGLKLRGTELIGLIPKAPLVRAGKYFYAKSTMSGERISNEDFYIDFAIKSMNMNDLAPFDKDSRIIEKLLKL